MNNDKDFRIGNLMQDRQGRLCRVDELSPKSVKAHAIVGPMTALPCSPIPLTEEIVVNKFGINSKRIIGTTVFVYETGIPYETGSGTFQFVQRGDEKFDYLGAVIETVHKLQNICYLHTGKELIWK